MAPGTGREPGRPTLLARPQHVPAVWVPAVRVQAVRGPAMPETLAGTGILIRLGLRRDRWLLPVWVLGFAVVAYSTALAGADLYPDAGSRIEAANALNATASMVAMFGRIYDPASLGALSLIKYTAFMTAILAVLMVILIIRHTRADEESGRLELLGGGRLGPSARAGCPPRGPLRSRTKSPPPGWRSAPSPGARRN